ncbi:sulfatase-like hydrolase/transferase [Flammeovirga kamogawensis]|uniref:Sulfatase-like hydrolase/transferase n=2 Tax=Flammeovirga kamogawensis TaxID=373891 RepID=A0ABX8H3P4_9BACT|nr:sulfatase-like hydrolase/transferase [Flammeovirga kamogawensis]TRX65674.1 sulfatase-like hydrolase/transferase [Flammeovirga kamogawensis]
MMNRLTKLTLKAALLFLVTLQFSQADDGGIKKAKKPNVLVILADDLGYNDVGFNGSTEIPTPNIDRIANEGVHFTNGYVSYAVCGPSRAGLITGRYQDRFGCGRNPLWAPNDVNQGLALSEETIADVLGREGYKSMALGKWHLGAHEDLRPLNRGFDEFYGFLTGGHNYFPEELTLSDISKVTSQFHAYKTMMLHNNVRVKETEYVTDGLSREAAKFIDNNADKPFFMYLAYNAPHSPLQATQKYLDRFSHLEKGKRKTYCAMVSALDDGVGRVLEMLEKKGIADNTIVIFLSDNGGPLKYKTDNGALRAGKGSIYEGGIRVPFAMRWPNKIKAGTVYDEPVISLDIMGIAVAYANASPKNQIDGVNIVPYITGDKKGVPHDELRWRMFDKKHYAVRKGNIKYINKINKKNGKVLQEYYDVKNDISEAKPLKLSASEKEDLQANYDSWVDQLLNPKYLGLGQDKKYTELHPNRYNTVVY